MGVVTVSSSASRTPLGLSTKLASNWSSLKKPLIVAFKGDKTNKTVLVAPQDQIILPVETRKEIKSRVWKAKKSPNRVKAAATDEASTSTMEVDYNEAAAKLENIFKLSPADMGDVDGSAIRGRRRRRRKASSDGDERTNKSDSDTVVRNRKKKPKRLSLDKRVELKRNKEEKEVVVSVRTRKASSENEEEKIEKLVRDYSASTDLVSLDWKKMKIPPVLPSSEHSWLFKLMQPLKVSIFLRISLRRIITKDELN